MGGYPINNNKLTLIQINDSHGYISPHPELFFQGRKLVHKICGGYARIKTIIDNIREEEKDVLFVDGGDTFHGTYPAVRSEGKDLIPLLNYLNPDAMTGHWEFAYGPEKFINLTRKLDYPMLAINCYWQDNQKPVFDPFLIREVADIKVAIIGIAATIVDKVMPSHFSEGLYFTLGREELAYYLEELEREVDLIVVDSHLGFPQDVQLAQDVPGIDVILSGHTHNRIEKPFVTGNTIIIQSGCHGSFLGKLTLEIEKGTIKKYEHKFLTVSEQIKADNEMQGMVEDVLYPYKDYLQEIVGYTYTPLNRYNILESSMDNFLLEALLKITGADIVFSNGWRYGAPIPPGEIKRNDLYNIIPTNPPVSTVELTGREIWQMLEENIERTFSRDPYKQMGGYVKRCRGLTVYVKLENPPGCRVQSIFIQGKKLDPYKTYKTAFFTVQGVPHEYGKNRSDHELSAIECLENYLREEKVHVEIENNIQLI